MKKFLMHVETTFSTLTVVEATSPEEAELYFKNHYTPEYQKKDKEEIISVSEVPEDYNLHTDAESKGYY